jgi:hypothetical protein
MKKYIVALFAIAALTSCSGSAEEKVENKVDSTVVVEVVDTAAVADTVAVVDTIVKEAKK